MRPLNNKTKEVVEMPKNLNTYLGQKGYTILKSELTIKHLKDCNFDIHPSRIFYSRNKGEKLKEIVLNIFPDIQHILFVDDLEENLLNVLSTFNQSELSKYNLELYKIKHV